MLVHLWFLVASSHVWAFTFPSVPTGGISTKPCYYYHRSIHQCHRLTTRSAVDTRAAGFYDDEDHDVGVNSTTTSIPTTYATVTTIPDNGEVDCSRISLHNISINPATLNSTTNPLLVPTVKQLLTFAIPAVGVWLCNPLLSMIDTSVVGLYTGTAQQAALNPAVAVTDYSARIFLSFLYAGTTNMIATTQSQTNRNETHAFAPSATSITARRFQEALRLALVVGTGLGLYLLVFARVMLRGLMGTKNGIVDNHVLEAASKYVWIRALGMPAAAIIGTSQAACLGLKDIRSPLVVMITAAGVNFILDMLLVPRSPAWIGGTAGAAWATMISQYVAMGLFLRWLCHEYHSEANSRDRETTRQPPSTTRHAPSQSYGERDWQRRIMSLPAILLRRISLIPNRISVPTKSTTVVTTKGLLNGHWSWKDVGRLPGMEVRQLFQPYVLPVMTTQVGRCSTYIAMGHTISSSFGTVAMAANQIVTSVFYTLIPIADSLSLTAQSFLPSIVALPASWTKAVALQRTQLNLLKVAGMLGIFLSCLVSLLPAALPVMFTTDPSVIATVKRIVPVLFCIFSLHGVFCGSEGILLGQRDLKFLGRMYAIYFAVVPWLMLRIKFLARQSTAALATTKTAAVASAMTESSFTVPLLSVLDSAILGRRPADGNALVDLSTVWNLFLAYHFFRILTWLVRVIWLQGQHYREATAAATTTTDLSGGVTVPAP